VRTLARHLPDEIAGPSARRDLVALSDGIPRRIVTLGFECRLADDDAIDLGFSIAPENGGRDALVGSPPDPTVERVSACNATWARVRDLARRWIDPTSHLHTWVPFLFFELDAGSACNGIPSPSVFVALDSRLDGAPGIPGGMRAAPELAAAREAAERLGGLVPGDPVDEMLARCFDLLPRGARVLHVGVMASRREPTVRLSVLLLEADLESFLAPLDATVVARAAAHALKRLPGRYPLAQVDFDLTSVQSKIGLGLQPRSPDGPNWSTLIDEVMQLSEGRREKAKAVLRWPGKGLVSIAGRERAIRRELSHLKLVCSVDAPIQAKAYLGIRPERATE